MEENRVGAAFATASRNFARKRTESALTGTRKPGVLGDTHAPAARPPPGTT
jgi:hypothetical protein